MATAIWTYRDQTLRGRSLDGFDVEAADGRIGRVERTASDRNGSYLVVDAGTMAPLGGRILVPAGLIDRVEFDDERIHLRSTRDQLTAAPAYDWRVPLEQHHRDQFASYYGSTTRAPQLRSAESPRSTRRPASSTPSASRSEKSTRGQARSRPKSTPRSTRSRSGAEPTKEQLYQEARKLGIEGRSKMSKAQLSRAVGRRRGRGSSKPSASKANPVEVQRFLEGVGYPARPGELVAEAKRQGASAEVRKTLERLPDKRFRTPAELSKAIGKLR